jgi:hypothetical protein
MNLMWNVIIDVSVSPKKTNYEKIQQTNNFKYIEQVGNYNYNDKK